MPIVQIILLIIAVLVAGGAAFLLGSYFFARKRRASLPRELGSIMAVAESKIPGMEQYHLMILKKGRPSYCMSTLRRKGSFRLGAKVPVVVETVTKKGQQYRVGYILQKRKAA